MSAGVYLRQKAQDFFGKSTFCEVPK